MIINNKSNRPAKQYLCLPVVVELTVRDVMVLVAKLVVRVVPVADFSVDDVAGFFTVSLLIMNT